MTYREGEDEFGTNELHWYAVWECHECRHVIHDYEDEFKFPLPADYARQSEIAVTG
jgi:hypothetical protein